MSRTGSRRPSRGRHTSRRPPKTGLLIALAFALIGAGVVLFVFISNKPRGAGGGGAVRLDGRGGGVGEMPENVGEATDITAVGGTTDARFQIADKKDPSRVAVELVFAKLDPLGGGAYQTTEPRAWIHMKDGRTVYIRADRGRIRRPPGGGASGAGAAPESGEFSGNGVVLVFPPEALADDGGVGLESDAPAMVGRFETAAFDTVLLEMSSQDPWTVESAQFRATGTGFVVRANQVLERLEFAKINGDGVIRYRADGLEPDAGGPVASAAEFVGPPAPRSEEVEEGGVEVAEAGGSAPEPAAGVGDDALTGPPAPDGAVTTAKAKEDLYLAEFRSGVTLTQRHRRLRADLLSVWTRFVDNKLPEGALGTAAEARRMKPSGDPVVMAAPVMPLAAQLGALVLAQAGSAGQDEPPRLFSESESDVVLRWSGVMVARPIASGAGGEPSELTGGNHVFARFTSDGRGTDRVDLSDAETGAAGVCAWISYAATKRVLTLGAAGAGVPGCDRVDFTMPGAGRLVGQQVAIDLDTGVCRVDGGGAIVQLPDLEDPDLVTVRPEFPPLADPDAPMPNEGGPEPRIAWRDGAEFHFRVRGGRMTDVLSLARFAGGVAASDRSSWLSGERLTAWFAERAGRKMALRRVVINGAVGGEPALAVGRSGRTGADAGLPAQDSYISADRIDVRLAPSVVRPGEDDATRTLAEGRVRVADRRSALAADWLDARLIRTGRGDYEAGEVHASGGVGVRLRTEDGEVVTAAAHRLHADGQSRWVDFIADAGSEVTLARGPSMVAGPQMHLQESDGSLQVFGAGRVRHVERSRGASESAEVPGAALADAPESDDLPEGLTRMDVTWTRSMSFADRTGRVECHGDATVSALTREGGQVARAERMLIDITPVSTGSPGSAESSGTPDPSVVVVGGGAGDRRVLRAEAIGAVLEREGGAPASVKSWTFGAATAAAMEGGELVGPVLPPRREYEQVLYIEGPRIVVDEVAGTMAIPDAGRGVTLDRGGSGGRGVMPSEGGRSQFRWDGSMDFNRLTGELRMRRNVELRHLPMDSGELVTMTCDDLTALLRTGGGVGAAAGGGGSRAELRSAEAVGAVHAQSGSRQVTADVLSFDAASSIAMARSTGEQPVMMQDTRQAGGAPLLARALRWDMRTDRVEVTEAMPVTGALTR